MQNRAKHELLVGIQYLLIGVIAELVTNRWWRQDRSDLIKQITIWASIAIALGLIRFVIIIIASLLRRDQWQTISRRNWI